MAAKQPPKNVKVLAIWRLLFDTGKEKNGAWIGWLCLMQVEAVEPYFTRGTLTFCLEISNSVVKMDVLEVSKVILQNGRSVNYLLLVKFMPVTYKNSAK